MQGIDISNWQEGLNVHALDIDFCICKATEGVNFVDTTCDGFIQQCKDKIYFGDSTILHVKTTLKKKLNFSIDIARVILRKVFPY